MKANDLLRNCMQKSIKYICAFLLVIGASTQAWGTQVTIKGTNDDSWTYTSSQIAITKSGVTLAAKGYSEGSVLASEIRVNNGGTITISASQAITAIEFTITSTAMFTQVDWDGKWTGSSTSVDFTAGGGQVVFTQVKVTIGGYVTLHDFAGDRMVAVGSTLPTVRMGTLKGWTSSELWSSATTTSAYPAFANRNYEGSEAPDVHDLWAVYQNDCDYTYSTGPTTVYHISSTAPASTSGGSTGYVKAYVNSVETYCNIPEGTTVEIRATEEGPSFTSWTVTKDGDGSTVVSVASSTSATTTFTMPAYNVSLTGNFGACSAPVVSNTGMTVTTYPDDAGFRVQGGRVTTKNGTITAYGWAYSTSHNPTTPSWTISADVAANTTWNYYGDATGLTPGGTYYLRAYATNNCGETGYGPEVTIVQPYYITINANGGTSAGSSGAYVKPNATTLTTITNAPTRTGYNLEGYYTSANCTTKVATPAGALQPSVSVSSTPWTDANSKWVRGARETIYANWEGKEYILPLNSEGGEGGSESVTVTYASNSHTAITNPTKAGYDFTGWFYNSTLVINTSGVLQNNVVVSAVTYTDASGNWKKDGTITLHAGWTPRRYTMTVEDLSNVTLTATDEEGSTDVTNGETRDVYCGNSVELAHGAVSGGKQWGGWKVTKTDAPYTDVTEDVIVELEGDYFVTMPAYAITVSANLYTDFVFSCAELTLTKPDAGDTVFITSTAEKTVRSQERFHVTGNGLTPSTALTFGFGNATLNSKFTFKLADGSAVSTNGSGAIDTDIYVFYTPAVGDTDDGLDKATILTASVDGTKPKTAKLDSKTIIGRHLPADFVIAAKKDGKWYALPANMTTGTPDIVEIAVDDADNPSMAYTATTNFYSIAQPNNASEKEYVRLKMQGQSNYPLFGSKGAATGIGKSSQSDADAEPILDGYLWKTIWVGNAITNAQDAIYRLYSKNKNDSLRIKTGKWGLYGYAKTTIQDIRLIPASSATVVEAYFIEYGRYGGVVEVDAQGISATKVKAKLSGNESSLQSLSQTLTSSKNYATKYNYTVNFGEGIDLAAASSLGKILMLEWYNSGDVLVGVTSIELPKIIAESKNMSVIESRKTEWAKWEVHILPGVTLTANLGSFSSGGAIRELHVYPGATFKVITAGTARTMTVDTLILRNGWTRAGSKRFDVARVYIQPYINDSYKAANLVHTNAYLDWYIDYDQYYPMAVPWPVTRANIKYKNSKIATSNIKYFNYDGALRATNVQNNQDANWAEITPTTFEPSKGYAILAKRPNGKAFGIVRMPLTFADTWTTAGEQGEVSSVHKDQVTVTAYGKGTTPWYAMGWNFIANPYMSNFNGDDDGITGSIETQSGTSYKYATIPTVDFTDYEQYPVAETILKPCSPFFVQGKTAAPGETVTFSKSKIITSAPQFRATPQPLPEQTAYIKLNHEGGKDMMGLIIGDDYTEDYEPDADLAKVMGSANTVKTYMHYANMDMAYVAINSTLAREWIPVTVKLPAAGEYTFSLSNTSVVNELEGIYLIDYSNNTTTNLIDNNYVFSATTEGTISNRFAINAIVGERKTPTPIDAIEKDHENTNEPIKFIYKDKMYIMFNGVIYDATGKKVR